MRRWTSTGARARRTPRSTGLLLGPVDPFRGAKVQGDDRAHRRGQVQLAAGVSRADLQCLGASVLVQSNAIQANHPPKAALPSRGTDGNTDRNPDCDSDNDADPEPALSEGRRPKPKGPPSARRPACRPGRSGVSTST